MYLHPCSAPQTHSCSQLDVSNSSMIPKVYLGTQQQQHKLRGKQRKESVCCKRWLSVEHNRLPQHLGTLGKLTEGLPTLDHPGPCSSERLPRGHRAVLWTGLTICSSCLCQIQRKLYWPSFWGPIPFYQRSCVLNTVRRDKRLSLVPLIYQSACWPSGSISITNTCGFPCPLP